MVGAYKGIRETVQEGNLYRLFSPREGDLTANEYVSSDGRKAALFAFLHSQQYLRPAPTLYLRGLDADAPYRIKTIDDKLVDRRATASGSFLMDHGLNLNLGGDYDSTLIVLEKAE